MSQTSPMPTAPMSRSVTCGIFRAATAASFSRSAIIRRNRRTSARPANRPRTEDHPSGFSRVRFYLISIALTVACVVHIMKTGRDRFWIYVVVFLPMAGPVAYLIVELLPGLWSSRGTRRALRSVRKTLDPEADLRRLESERRFSNSIDAHRRYAEELIANGRPGEAIQVYRESLKGIFE